MYISRFSLRVLAAAAVAVSLSACSDDDNNPTNDDDTTVTTDTDYAQFAIAASTTTSAGTSNVLLSASGLDGGSVSSAGNGLGVESATQWVFFKNQYLYALTYNQGNNGTTRSFYRDADGNIRKRSIEYSVSRFTTYGTYGDYIITASSAQATTGADANGYLPYALSINYLNVPNQEYTFNNTNDAAYSAENYLGNGEYVTLAGIAQRGSQLISAVIPMGLSQYGAAADGGKWVKYPELVKQEAGGSNSGAYLKGTVVGTQYPNQCSVAIYDDETMTTRHIATTDKISYACGRFKSQYYQTTWVDDNGDIYVFSPSYAKTLTEEVQRTTLPAGVCRIPKGSNEFDSYYCDLEAQSDGAGFLQCWYIGGEYFLLMMYDRPFSETGYTANRLAVYNTSSRRLTYVTGLPSSDLISGFGKNIYSEGTTAYLAVTPTEGYPAIYAIDGPTASAVRGLEVQCSSVGGAGKLLKL